MKRRLNILCVIVMLVLSYSVIESLYYMGVGVSVGVKAGIEIAEDVKNNNSASDRHTKSHELANMKYVALLPHAIAGKEGELLNDSIYNEKTGKFVPAMYSTMAIGIETQESVVSKVLSGLAKLLGIVTVVWAMVLFIKIIVAINRSDIFNWRNVRYLRRLGVLLIISFGCSLLSEYLSLYNLREVLSLPSYDLTLSDMVSTTTLVLGLSALIVAEVFAIGLKMKEEQDLTI